MCRPLGGLEQVTPSGTTTADQMSAGEGQSTFQDGGVSKAMKDHSYGEV